MFQSSMNEINYRAGTNLLHWPSGLRASSGFPDILCLFDVIKMDSDVPSAHKPTAASLMATIQARKSPERQAAEGPEMQGKCEMIYGIHHNE